VALTLAVLAVLGVSLLDARPDPSRTAAPPGRAPAASPAPAPAPPAPS